MKILHLCLGNYYVENMEYNENVLPRKHKQLGHKVYIVASPFSFLPDDTRVEAKADNYINNDGIEVTILPYKKKYPKIARYFRLFEGLYEKLVDIAPDIVFAHGGQCYDLAKLYRYKKEHPKLHIFMDSHIDFYNTPYKTIKQKLFARYFWGYPMRKAEKYVDYFWGSAPIRLQYMIKAYNMSPDKKGVLVTGGDEDKIDFANAPSIRSSLRSSKNIPQDAFLLIIGGKFEEGKNLHLLANALNKIKADNVLLVVFGSVRSDYKSAFDKILQNNKIIYLDWLSVDETYNWFLASDLAVFPGKHSVLWEQAAATGLPLVVKHWEGMEQVDIGGNCRFLYEDSAEEIALVLNDIICNKDVYKEMKKIAVNDGIKEFAYIETAKKAITVPKE